MGEVDPRVSAMRERHAREQSNLLRDFADQTPWFRGDVDGDVDDWTAKERAAWDAFTDPVVERQARERHELAVELGFYQVAASTTLPPSEERNVPKPSDLAKKKLAAAVVPSAAMAEDSTGTEDDETYLTFTDALFAVTGTPTSDGRMLASDIDLTFRDTPMPLQWCEEMEGGHYGSVTVGVIESITLKKGEVLASGYMLNSENALAAIDLVSHGVCNPSIDPGGDDFEMIATYEDGTVVTEENYDPDQKIYATMTAAEILATTIVAIPAFGETRIRLNEQREARAKTLVASAVDQFRPRVKTYDPALFADPKLTRPTAPTMNNETGRIYGHLAEWGHKIRGGTEVTPRNHNGYLNFHTSQVRLDDGKQLSVGRLTVQGGHADTSLGVTVATARAHYDNVCTAFGLVRLYEDRFGIAFSGVPAPGVDPEVFQMGMTAPLSGDWRDEGRGLDMIGAHAVNTPGYPIYSAVTGPDGRDVALVASLGPSRKSTNTAGGFTLDRESLKTLLTEVVLTVDQRRADQETEAARAAAFASEREAALARARDVVGDPPTPAERIGELLAVHEGL